MEPWWGSRVFLGSKTKIVRDSDSSTCPIGVSIGIALKGLVKRVRHNECLTVGYIEFKLSSIWVTESHLHVVWTPYALSI